MSKNRKKQEGMSINVKSVLDLVKSLADVFLVVLTIIVFITNNFVSKADTKVIFKCNIETAVYAGVEYVEYKLSTVPSVQGYQIKPYSFVFISSTEESIHIPLENYFTQEQYSADEKGICNLLRENTAEDLKKLYGRVAGEETVEIGTILAVEYILEEKKHNEFFELRNGELLRMDIEAVEDIIDNFWEENIIKLDMEIFPSNEKEIEEQIRLIL